MLIKLLDHLLKGWGLTLLANVDSVLIDLHNVAHLEVLELEIGVLISFTL